MELKILHISDIHYAKDSFNQDKVLESFLRDIEKSTEAVDLILVTGDITKNASLEQFNEFYDKIILPIKFKFSLEDNKIIYVAGNHDFNRSDCKSFARNSIKALKTRDEANQTFKDLNESPEFLGGLNNYLNFEKEKYSDSKESKNHGLFHTHKHEINGKKIGIAALNSAWASWGGSEDYGTLLISERQLDIATKELKNCDFKICCFHHPLDWFQEHDKMMLRHQINSNYNIFLTGHEHTSYPYKHESNNNVCINLKAGCLYSSRDYYNGYSYINIDFENNTTTISYRTYFEQRREFDIGTDVIQNGKVTIQHMLSPQKIPDKNNKLERIDAIYNKIIPEITKSLILSDAEKNLSFKKVFIKPTIALSPEGQKSLPQENGPAVKYLDLDSIIFDNNNYLLTGKKESGKTTLLKFILCETLIGGDMARNMRTPIYIDYINDLKKGDNMLEKAIGKFFINSYDQKINVEHELKSDTYSLLIDNFDLRYPKKYKDLKKFASKYKNVKFIIATKETLATSVVSAQPGTSLLDFINESAYIYSFKRSHTRNLIQRVCDPIDINQEETILNHITKSLDDCLIPHTPFMISIALSVYQHDKQYRAINKASLVEKFIEVLLEKHNIKEDKSQLDYREKEDFLCQLVNEMVEKNNYAILVNDLEIFAIQFIKNTGLEASALNIITYFLEKKIFTQYNEYIEFNLKCFFEYFSAKLMTDNNEFYNKLLEEKKYLSFSEEIEYYAGLKRNDEELLMLLKERALKVISLIGFNVDLTFFDSKTSKFSILDSVERKDLVDQIENSKNDHQGRDEILDKSSNSSKDLNQKIEKETIDPSDITTLIGTLSLYGNVLKLSELIKKIPVKKEHTSAFISLTSQSLVALMLTGDKFIMEAYEDTTDIDKDIFVQEIFKYLTNSIVPGIALNYIADNFASPNFNSIYSDQLDDKKTLIETFVLLALISSTSPQLFIESAAKALKKIPSNSILFEILFIFVTLKYTMLKIPADVEKSFLDLISDMHLIREHYNGPPAERGIIKQRLKIKYQQLKTFRKKE